jgi:hypothetical protein
MLNPDPTKPDSLQSSWDPLVGEDLSGIVFVRNYLQLQFSVHSRYGLHARQVA